MLPHLARSQIEELDPAPAREDIAVGGLVLIAAMVVSQVFGLDLLEQLARAQVVLDCEIGAPRGSPLLGKA
jgi:hypothetical protein